MSLAKGGFELDRPTQPIGTHRALEAILLLTVRGLKEVATTLQEKVYSVIPQLRFGVSPAELRDLLECKRSVEDVLLGGRAIQSALSMILGEGECHFPSVLDRKVSQAFKLWQMRTLRGCTCPTRRTATLATSRTIKRQNSCSNTVRPCPFPTPVA